ncbi:MAG TPA: NAD(P)-dependent oxidoreductase [Lunatimonas sp.]|nr:NAD(P)-dependent oxidoreductase [Lunatimonas sp.]
MKILVTGASGFIGGKIVDNLAKDNRYEILATGRSHTDRFKHHTNVTYLQQDLKNNLPNLYCDVCIHCAGLADDRSTFEQLISHNVSTTENLLLALQNCNLLIFISSASVYDFSDGKPRKEEDVDLSFPLSSYGKSKIVAENMVVNSTIKSIYILRPRAVYGPGDRVLLPRILRLIKANKMIVPANLTSKASLTHIENLYEAVTKSISQAKSGTHIFNIADNMVYDLNAVFSEILIKKVSKKSFIRIPARVMKSIVFINNILGIKGYLNEQSYKYIVEHSQLSIEKAEKQLNYTGKQEFYKSIDQLDI